MTDTTPRVTLLPLAESAAAAAAAGVPEQMAPLSVFRVLLHHPAVARELASTLNTLLFSGNKLDARLRELIIMRIGWKTKSLYEWTQHWRVAHVMLNIPEQDLVAVFMPTHLMPPSGFTVFVPRRKVTIIDMKVEDAAKIILSAGMVTPDTQERLQAMAEAKRKSPRTAASNPAVVEGQVSEATG